MGYSNFLFLKEELSLIAVMLILLYTTCSALRKA